MKALRHLKVKLLVIPATADFSHVWISKFGFHHVEDSLKKEMRSMNLLAFPGIDMLQKELVAPQDVESSADTGLHLINLASSSSIVFSVFSYLCSIICQEDCNPCNEGIDTANTTNEDSVSETTSPSGDKPISDYAAEHHPSYVDVNSTSRDGYPKIQETEFKTSTMAAPDTEGHMDCKTSINPFDSLMESPPQRNSDMAFLDHIIRSPVDTGHTESGVVYSSDDDDDSPAR